MCMVVRLNTTKSIIIIRTINVYTGVMYCHSYGHVVLYKDEFIRTDLYDNIIGHNLLFPMNRRVSKN